MKLVNESKNQLFSKLSSSNDLTEFSNMFLGVVVEVASP